MALDNQLSNRDLAVTAWAVVCLAAVILHKSMRGSLYRVVRAALAWKLSVSAMLLGAYVVLACVLLRRAGFWETAMLKDTILWFVLSGLTLGFAFKRSAVRGWWWSAVSAQLSVLVLIEYMAAAYTFSLPVELVLQPVCAGIVVVHGVSETDSKYGAIRKVTGALLTLGAVYILGNAALQAVQASDVGASTVKAILLPGILTVAFLPAAYCYHLVVAYEGLFLRLELVGPGDKALKRYGKRALLKMLGVSVHRIHRFMETAPRSFAQLRTREDVDMMVERGLGIPREDS